MTMFAKIKNGHVVAFPYGYDQLQAENPHTRYTGVIDLQQLFKDTEEAILHGAELVEVQVAPKPFLLPHETAKLSGTPVLEDGRWVLGWVVDRVGIGHA